MKVAVAGCNGRIGRRVVLFALKGGHHVVGLDRILAEDVDFREDPSFTFIEVDLLDFDQTLKALEGCEAIMQLAALPHPGDFKVIAHNTNVTITWNILRAAAELEIGNIAQASSVNVLSAVFSIQPHFEYFPIDEDHPCLPDEPYGLSKLIAETQADAIVRRYSNMRIASLRLHWTVPTRRRGFRSNSERAKGDLWGYVQEDSAAEAFLLAVDPENQKWSGHERFFIIAPRVASDEGSRTLKETYWPDVPVKPGKEIFGSTSFYDCSKAERLLGWVHTDYAE